MHYAYAKGSEGLECFTGNLESLIPNVNTHQDVSHIEITHKFV